ncbi:MAG TPA: hypothetical protein VK254_00950 [Candidatus Bathyarchaeia archaeon]|nr:hypothetical protein [Candidatus Bathyarchaeia archaeon]
MADLHSKLKDFARELERKSDELKDISRNLERLADEVKELEKANQ